jgi:AraC family transcriptional activator of mtrCDE
MWNRSHAVVLDFSDSWRMRNILDALIEEEQKQSSGSRAMIKALMNQYLVTIFRRLDEQAEGQLPWLWFLQSPRLTPVMEQVLAEPGLSHSLESLAEISGMSRSSFASVRAVNSCAPPISP